MEQAARDLLNAVAGGAGNVRNVNTSRSGIGTTHHEAGTLWMGAPGASVTDTNGRFHHVPNAYVAGPALFPEIGSANASLTATTICLRSADGICASSTVGSVTAFK